MERRAMHEGAIAIVDALGFKGIWRRAKSDAVLQTMHDIAGHVNDVAESCTGSLKQLTGPGRLPVAPITSCAFLSDAIVMAIHVPNFGNETDPTRLAILRETMAVFLLQLASYAQLAGSGGEVPLNYRGAATWGEFMIDGSFIIGPAVDQAAEMHEQPDGALIEATAEIAEVVMATPSRPDTPPR